MCLTEYSLTGKYLRNTNQYEYTNIQPQTADFKPETILNRQLFLQLLEHPDSVSEQENIALKKFTEDFPYCQTGQLLFVKHLHSQQSVHYPEQLKIAAAYVADRKVLYNLIHTAPS